MSDVDPVTMRTLRDFLTRLQMSLKESADLHRKQAENNGTPALVERAAIYTHIANIIGTWKP